MRSKRALLLTIVGLLTCSSITRADESPKDLLERAYQALGGFDKLAKFKATQVRGTGIIYLPEAEISFTMEGAAQLPDKFKNTLKCEINGMKITTIQTLVGDKATSLLNGNPQELDDTIRKEMKEQVYLEHVTSLLPLREPRFTLTSLGESTIDGQPALGIKIESKDHREVSIYFDKKTALVAKAAYKGLDPITMKEVSREQFYRDYKEQGESKYAAKSQINQDGKKYMVLELTEYKAFEKLDNAVFNP